MTGAGLVRGRVHAAALSHLEGENIVELYPDEVQRDLGALSPPTMARVGEGLRAALGI